MERNPVAQPLFLSKPESFWEKVHYVVNIDGEYGRRSLLAQLTERVQNNINLEEYWTDKDDLAIAKIVIDAMNEAVLPCGGYHIRLCEIAVSATELITDHGPLYLRIHPQIICIPCCRRGLPTRLR